MTETTAPDSYQELLNMDATDAKRPPTRPGGTYLVRVAHVEDIVSSVKRTPGKQYTFASFEPQNDVDSDAWNEYLSSPLINPQTDNMNYTFYITLKALFMIKEFAEKCGIKIEGKTIGTMAEECIGTQVLVNVKQNVSDRPPHQPYANIDSFAEYKEES